MTSGRTKWSMTVQIRIEATTAKSVTSARHLVRVGVRVRVRGRAGSGIGLGLGLGQG